MNFLEAVAIFLLILILIVIVHNILLHGRDLAKYPKRNTKHIKRNIDNYYPGSPHDEYESETESDTDDDSEDIKPRNVAHYVSSHMSKNLN